MSLIYVGIDNGISGGMCAISEAHGRILDFAKMPIRKHKNTNEVDVRAFHLWVTEVTGGNLSNAVYVLEEPGGSKSAKAAKSMAGSFHSLRGFFETKFLRWERVTPQSWQKVMLGKFAKGQSKVRALEVARDIWPDESFIPKGCRTPNDGIIDAALIAEYARRKEAV